MDKIKSENKSNSLFKLLNFLFTSSLSTNILKSKKYIIQLTTGILLITIPLCVDYYFSVKLWFSYEFSNTRRYTTSMMGICFTVWLPMLVLWFLNLWVLYAMRTFVWFFFLMSTVVSAGLISLTIWIFLTTGIPIREIGQRPLNFAILLLLPLLVAIVSYKYIKKGNASSEDILNGEIPVELIATDPTHQIITPQIISQKIQIHKESSGEKDKKR